MSEPRSEPQSGGSRSEYDKLVDRYSASKNMTEEEYAKFRINERMHTSLEPIPNEKLKKLSREELFNLLEMYDRDLRILAFNLCVGPKNPEYIIRNQEQRRIRKFMETEEFRNSKTNSERIPNFEERISKLS